MKALHHLRPQPTTQHPLATPHSHSLSTFSHRPQDSVSSKLVSLFSPKSSMLSTYKQADKKAKRRKLHVHSHLRLPREGSRMTHNPSTVLSPSRVSVLSAGESLQRRQQTQSKLTDSVVLANLCSDRQSLRYQTIDRDMLKAHEDRLLFSNRLADNGIQESLLLLKQQAAQKQDNHLASTFHKLEVRNQKKSLSSKAQELIETNNCLLQRTLIDPASLVTVDPGK